MEVSVYIKQHYFLKVTGLHVTIKIVKQTQYCSFVQIGELIVIPQIYQYLVSIM